ncbi:MAG: flavodoxin [Saccharofermentans sp.]|nr:flavodoxin [Saccharofermentans sp.]
MGKTLVAYFSASGITKKKAEQIAEGIGADLYEITPKVLYTEADLNWMDKNSRSSIEMNDKKFRPEMADNDAKVEEYDRIVLGFPIWWYVAPTIVNTFLERFDFTGKKILVFATSGGSSWGNTIKELMPSAPGAEFIETQIINSDITDADIKKIFG